MKRLLMALFFLSLNISLFAQSTPVSDLRVATATTTFGINLPIGTKVYNIADGKYWVATAGVLSTLTLTTGSASFTQLNAATDISGKVNISDTAAMLNHYAKNTAVALKVNISDTAAMLTNVKNNINLRVKIADTATMLNHYAKTVNVELKSNKVTSFSSPTDVQYPSAKLVSDQLNLHVNIADTAAMLSTYKKTATTEAVIHGGTGLTTITSGSYMIGNGTGNVALKTPAQVLSDIGAAAAASASLFKVESFEEATTGSTGTSHTLASTPKAATSIQVNLNGAMLTSSQYTYTSATPAIQITIPVYQYDKCTISYGY